MTAKARELTKPGSGVPAGDGRRRLDRVYEDQVWEWAKSHPGQRPWLTEETPPASQVP